MSSKRYSGPTNWKLEFWTCAGGQPRKHRQRYYSTSIGMLKAGARWEARGQDYWCRYWNGPTSHLSNSRPPVDGSQPALLPETLKRSSELIN